MTDPANRSRLTVVERVYFQSPHQDPVPADSLFSRDLETDEQPYSRRVKVGEDWQRLDYGWLTECSMLVIRNDGEQRYAPVAQRTTQGNPTPEEKAEMESRVVEVGIYLSPYAKHVTVCTIPPGESCRCRPVSLVLLRLRCLNGSTRCTVSIFPK